MTRPGLTPMTKIEVVITRDDLAALLEVLTAAGATGYTSIGDVSGVGHHPGIHQGRLAFGERTGLNLVITVVPDDRVEAILAGVRRLLVDRSGVMFVSETSVSRPEYFR